MAFSYPPLPGGDALRLLTLKAGGFYDPLQGDLVPIAFSAKPKYLALSYTWGDPTSKQLGLPVTFTKLVAAATGNNSDNEELTECQKEAILELNGHGVPIKHNLALALHYIRSASHPLTIWVDAVCINQADIDERNSQVALMALIYSRAAAVVTWLGLNGPEVMGALQGLGEDGGIKAAMAMKDVYELGNSKELASWFAEYTASPTSGVGARNARAAGEKEALERIAAANQLGDAMVMPTGYWRRVWVVQEVCLAQRVLFAYGPTLLADEEAVRRAAAQRGGGAPPGAAGGMDNMLEARRRRFGEAMRLETLVEDFAGQLCSEARDKIYGLVGLANDVNADADADDGRHWEVVRDDGSADVDLVIDYRRAYYDIWCDVVQYLFRCPFYFVPPHLDTDEGELARLRHERLTRVVRFAGLVQNTLQDEVERELARLAATSSSSSSPSAGQDMEARLRGPKLLGRHLVPARGYLAGKIVGLGPSYAAFVGSFRHQTAWRTGWRRHYRKEQDLQQLREMEERYAAKILEYREADVARVARIRTNAGGGGGGDDFVAFYSPDDGPLDELTNPQQQGGADDGARILDNLLAGRAARDDDDRPDGAPGDGGEVRRFLGTNYCMGLAPPGAAAGDWVLRFWDCDAAVVVRPDDPRDPRSPCALVGRADVADIHDRKGQWGDTVADAALTRQAYDGAGEDRRMDMVMSWRTLQLVTASIAT
ncbi:putative HET domain-containing protein [Rosellinia necatrix]|uniref:Putative HET domain-containing protein n=1 Tax=Rosellinia necatrix TaxID=77044 RepID=A0A1W2TVG9_ROSNE|nr:putative HET domain-containing protein [Rosellinia necatrix]